MSVLVLGGCGFIGSHVVDALLAAGVRPRVLDLRPEAFRAPLPGVDYRFGDFRDPGVIAAALEGVDSVFHLVSTTFPGTASRDPQRDVSDNLLGTLRLLEAMGGRGVRRLLFLSSGGTVYGIPRRIPTPEDEPLAPIASYGIVKASIEHYLEAFRRENDLQPLIVRASNPYGVRQGHTNVQGVVATFVDRLVRGLPLEIWGDGSVRRDLLAVEDLAAFCTLAGLSDRCGTYNAGSGMATSLLDLIECLASVAGEPIAPVFREGRAIDVPVSVLDCAAALRDFGWQARRPLRQGLDELLTWRRRLDLTITR